MAGKTGIRQRLACADNGNVIFRITLLPETPKTEESDGEHHVEAASEKTI